MRTQLTEVASGDGDEAVGKRYLGGASAPQSNWNKACPKSDIPERDNIHGGHSEPAAHPRQLPAFSILLHPDICLLSPVRPRAGSRAGCESVGGGQGG